MSKAEIEAILQPQIRKSAFSGRILVWTYLALIAVTLVCEGMNIYAFRSQPAMLTTGVLLAVLTLIFLAFGVHVLRELTTIEQADESLMVKLYRRLHFYRTKYEIWLVMIALAVAFLTFAVSTLVDAQSGSYRINHPAVFVGFTLAQILFMYVVLKIGHYPLMRESKAILNDLENQVTTGTEQVKALKRRWRLWTLLFAVLGIVLLIWGILRAIS